MLKKSTKWFIKRFAISVGIAWSFSMFIGGIITIYVGGVLNICPTCTTGATAVMENVAIVVWQVFVIVFALTFVFVSIPMFYKWLVTLPNKKTREEPTKTHRHILDNFFGDEEDK